MPDNHAGLLLQEDPQDYHPCRYNEQELTQYVKKLNNVRPVGKSSYQFYTSMKMYSRVYLILT
jgi:hypothetical protein